MLSLRSLICLSVILVDMLALCLLDFCSTLLTSLFFIKLLSSIDFLGLYCSTIGDCILSSFFYIESLLECYTYITSTLMLLPYLIDLQWVWYHVLVPIFSSNHLYTLAMIACNQIRLAYPLITIRSKVKEYDSRYVIIEGLPTLSDRGFDRRLSIEGVVVRCVEGIHILIRILTDKFNSVILLALVKLYRRFLITSFTVIFIILFHSRFSFLVLVFRFLLLDKCPQHSNFVIFVRLKIESILLSESELQQIVIQRFLRNAYFLSCIFEWITNQIVLIIHHAIVKLSP